MCSCHIPLFMGYEIPRFRGEKYIDGGFKSGFDEPIECETPIIQVSPFSGNFRIAPASDSTHRVVLSNMSLDVSTANIKSGLCPKMLSTISMTAECEMQRLPICRNGM